MKRKIELKCVADNPHLNTSAKFRKGYQLACSTCDRILHNHEVKCVHCGEDRKKMTMIPLCVFSKVKFSGGAEEQGYYQYHAKLRRRTLGPFKTTAEAAQAAIEIEDIHASFEK